jgi:exodeoxyribonuclease VII large subunit
VNSYRASDSTLSVSQLNRQAKRLLESHFDFVWVEGELSNLATPASGHWYFTLKDDRSQVRCAMFRNSNQRVAARPRNGDQLRIRARVSLYEGRGDFQLIAEHMEPAGAGALQLAFEQLKQRLQAEGLFSDERKQALPALPSHIAVITSPSGAAIRDILSVFRRRFPSIRLSIIGVPVQGAEAAPAIVSALRSANINHQSGKHCFDALLLSRGGGSIEDLWAFNEEAVARAIADSQLPVISAVGHEIDFTIADFVADIRAPTPSAAAELLSPDREELLQDLRRLESSLLRIMRGQLAQASDRVSNLRRHVRHPGERLQEQAQRLDEYEQRLRRGLRRQLQHKQQLLALQSLQLRRLSPDTRLQRLRLSLQHLQQRANSGIRQLLLQHRQRLASTTGLLDSISPLATLERGYALVTDTDGKVVTDAATLQAGDVISTRLARGSFRSEVVADD